MPQTDLSPQQNIIMANRGLESNNAAVDLMTQGVTSPGGVKLSIPSRWMIQDTRSARDVKKLSPYDFILHTYRGSHGYVDNSYLVPHLREMFYEERRMLSDYRNVFKNGMDSLIDPVFSGVIQRTSSSALYEAFILDADKCGTPLHSILKNAILHARLFDVSFVVMDNLPADVLAGQTEESSIRGRLFPYVYEKFPQEVHNWTVKSWGALDTITFRDHIEQRPNESNALENVQYYRKWDANGWEMYHEVPDKDRPGKMVKVTDGQGTHGLGVLPVIPILDFAETKNLTVFPDPSFLSIVSLCFSLYNKESWVVTQEVHQGFPILCTSGFDSTQLSLSATNFINVPTDAKFPPQYAMPPQDGIKVLVDNCERLKEEIRYEFSMHGVEAVARSQRGTSGISKEWDFRAKEVKLKEISKATVALEQAVAKMFKRYTRKEFEYKCTYPSEFSPTEADDSIDRNLKILKELPPEPVAEECWTEVARNLVKNDPERLNVLIEELEAYFEKKGAEADRGPLNEEEQEPDVEEKE